MQINEDVNFLTRRSMCYNTTREALGVILGQEAEDRTLNAEFIKTVRVTQQRLLLSILKAVFFKLLVLQMPRLNMKTVNVARHSVGTT